MAMIERVCTHCGKTIQVPEELEQYSCVYCGATMTAPQLAAQAVSNEADREFVLSHLIDGVRDNPKYYEKNFNKKGYEAAFFAFKRQRLETYQAMERYISANPERREMLLEEFTDRFIEDWSALYPRKKAQRTEFAAKMTLALFEVPAILHMNLSCGPDYCARLEQKFNAKYPDNLFHVGTYEVLAEGFERKKLCFITTAVCEFEGKRDDCAELTAFRAFRDGWMRQNGDEKLIEEYYAIAPAIVTAIDYCTDRDQSYQALRRDYLTPCYEALQQSDYPTCRAKYIEMVQTLKTRFHFN